MKNVIILGGGSSVSDIESELDKLKDFGHVIGVNDAPLYTHVHECVTMDRLWFENRWRMIPETIPLYMRRTAIKNPHERKNVVLYENDHTKVEMSDDERTLNGTNSGMVAINRAYHLRPERVYLLGFDMYRNDDGQAYWYPPYHWAKPEGSTGEKRYTDWSLQFNPLKAQFASRGIELCNVGLKSRIECLPKISTDEFAEMINAHFKM